MIIPSNVSAAGLQQVKIIPGAVGTGDMYAYDYRVYTADNVNPNGSVQVISAESDTLLEKILVGAQPRGLTQYGQYIFCTNFNAASVASIDALSNTVKSTSATTGYPIAICRIANNNLVAIADYAYSGSGYIRFYNNVSNGSLGSNVGNTALPAFPYGVGYDPQSGQTVAVMPGAPSKLSFINSSYAIAKTLDLSSTSGNYCRFFDSTFVSGKSYRGYTLSYDGYVTEIDLSTQTVSATLAIPNCGSNAGKFCFGPDYSSSGAANKYMYVPSTTGFIYVVDLQTMSLVQTVPTPDNTAAWAAVFSNNKIYVSGAFGIAVYSVTAAAGTPADYEYPIQTSVGAGASANGTSVSTPVALTWTHTVTDADNMIVAAVGTSGGSTYETEANYSMTMDGVLMTKYAYTDRCCVFTAPNSSAGTRTFNFYPAGLSTNAGTVTAAANSMAFANVGALGDPVTAPATSSPTWGTTSLDGGTHAVTTSAPGGSVIAYFVGLGSSAAPTASNTTNATGKFYVTAGSSTACVGFTSGANSSLGFNYSPSGSNSTGGTIAVTLLRANSSKFTTTLLNFNDYGDFYYYRDLATKTAWTHSNYALISGNKKYGTNSIYITSGGYIYSSSATSNFAFGTGDFTVEMWFNLLSGPNGWLYDSRGSGTNGAYVTMGVSNGKIAYYSNSAEQITGTTALTTGVWYHVAVCRSSGTTRLFLNGVQEGSSWTDSQNYISGTSRPMIGGNGNTGVGTLDGYVDDLRISKGYAYYTSNFTPPAKRLVV